MKGCVKKNRNAEMVCVGKKGESKVEIPEFTVLTLGRILLHAEAGQKGQKCALKYII